MASWLLGGRDITLNPGRHRYSSEAALKDPACTLHFLFAACTSVTIMEDHNPWVAPEAFVFEGLLDSVIRSQQRWQQTLQALRLVNRAWRHGASSAVSLLAPRPPSCISDLVLIPQAFSGVKLLRHQSILTDGPSVEYLIPALCEGLPSLRTLLLLNCPITATSAAALSRYAVRSYGLATV